MNGEKQELRIKRVFSRKRPRDVLRTHLTPVNKRGGGSQQCPSNRRLSSIMADVKAVEVTTVMCTSHTQ